MKKIYLALYFLIGLIVIAVLGTIYLLGNPSVFDSQIKEQLDKYHVKYEKLEGGIFSDLILHDFNYEDKLKAKKVSIKVDLGLLSQKVVKIETLTLEDVWIDESLFDVKESNSTSESNSTLPIEKLIVNQADISLKDIRFKEYFISSLKLKIRDLESDLKKSHKAKIEIDLNSNVSDMYARIDAQKIIKVEATLSPKVAFINKFTKEHNLTINSLTKVDINATTNLESVGFSIRNHAIKLKYDSHMISPKNLMVDGVYDIKSTLLDAKTSLTIISDFADINLKIENKKTTDIKFKATLTPKVSSINKLLKEKNINIDSSENINLEVKTDMKIVDFRLLSDGLKLLVDKNRISPKDINISGSYDINKNKLSSNIDMKILTDLAKVVINSKNSFDMIKESFSSTGVIKSDKEFNINYDIKKSDGKIIANLDTTATKVVAKFDTTSEDLEAGLNISSLKSLLEKIGRVYPLNIGDIDGKIDLSANQKSNILTLKLDAPYIKADDLVVKNIKLEASKKDNLINLQKVDFLVLLKELKLKKHFYLLNKGYFNLETQESNIRFNHGISLSSYKKGETLNANIKIEKLKIEIKEYGKYTLSTDINYIKKGKQQTILGDVNLHDIYITYQSSAFSPDSDPDIIFVDKNLKETSEDFLKYTKLDVNIKSKKSKYKVDNLNIDFDINMNIKKEFNRPMGIFGRVENIKGDIIQAPKRFKLVDSAIIFQGSQEINPTLDLKVLYNLPQVKIQILISGNKVRPKVDFKSTPPMPKKDIISYLLFGISTNSFKNAEGSLSKEATLFVLNQAAQDFAIEFDLDRIYFTDDGTPDGMDVEVGKKISKKSMGVIKNTKEGNSYILEYELNDKVKLKLGNHQKTKPSQSLELFYKKRF